ncbi:MAG: hypothetical protein ACTHJT_06600 [Cytophaga sp.]|uniref:hypothetical protein n=1 Tax=Cytophaga sp. TaxID=29535 RepID=UPI003F7FCCD5
MERIDPINNGSKIFFNLFKNSNNNTITDLPALDIFLNKLITETEGLIIVDFLDQGNWDCLGSYHIDYSTGYVFLHWHQYKIGPLIENYIDDAGFKPNIYTLMIHFKELRMDNIKDLPFVGIRGFALKEKEVLKYLTSIGQSNSTLEIRNENFCSLYSVDRGNYFEDCFCHDTPIYSILIIPKDKEQGSSLSQKILFLYNYSDCLERLEKVETTLSTKKLSEDEICEKANTIRRIFEYVLKIECCFHSKFNYSLSLEEMFNKFLFKKHYSDLNLGDLISILKFVKQKDQMENLNKIVRFSNELSHDSGKPIRQEMATELLNLTINYIDELVKLIK